MAESRVGRRHVRDWEDAAANAMYWSIVRTDVSDQNGLVEFFDGGRVVVRDLLDDAASLGYPNRRATAFDFGCGAGRLTRALADCFDQVVGVDVSEAMVTEARRINSAWSNCSFEVIDYGDLRPFRAGSFDLVLTHLVLQHLPSARSAVFHVRELVRLVRPGGVAIFQLPTVLPAARRVQPRRRMYRLLRNVGVGSRLLFWLTLQPIRMVAVPVVDVQEAVRAGGGRIVSTLREKWPDGTVSMTYFAAPVDGAIPAAADGRNSTLPTANRDGR